MENYNYADEIIKDTENLKVQKIDEHDILENILNQNFENQVNYSDTEDKIKGFMEGIKSDNIVTKL